MSHKVKCSVRGGDLSSFLFSSSFLSDNVYRHIKNGPIAIPTLVKLSSTGKPKRGWGMSIFYMPHGLTIDSQGHFWVTDVAMHQVSMVALLPQFVVSRAFNLDTGAQI